MHLALIFFTAFAFSTLFPAAEEIPADDETIGVEIRLRISQLDADTFRARDEATQALAAYGGKAIPFLVESLDNPSAELRMRVMFLLAECGTFDAVAPYLLKAIDRPGGIFARTVLQQRCQQQVDSLEQVANCERLFKFWGTTREKYRFESQTAFQNAKTTEQIAAVVEPLRHIRDKVHQFDDLVGRLAKLSVASDHRHSPGYAVAETLAQGLRTGRADWVAFSVKYVESLELLDAQLRDQQQSTNAIRQEIANRASWSQGATMFLIRLLDPDSQPSKALVQSIHIAPQSLHDSFFDGLGSADAASYSRGVGRVHIVDLLNDTIRTWPMMPGEGAVAELVGCIIEAAHEGNKPKALVFLEALESCRKLQDRGLDVHQPPAKQLIDRLLAGARTAPTHRDFYPTHTVHSKLVGLLDRGIRFDQVAFPREYFDQYVAGTNDAVSEEQRALLEKYLAIIDRLLKAGRTCDQPDVERACRVLRKQLASGSAEITTVARRLVELPATSRPDEVVKALFKELRLE